VYRHVVEPALAVLVLLARLSAPRPLRPDLEMIFGQDKTRLSRFGRAALDHIIAILGYTLAFDKVRLRRDIPALALAIGIKAGMPRPDVNRCWGFVDGTFRPIASPVEK
jgi:hypothetical protein